MTAANPTCFSGSRATVHNGICGRLSYLILRYMEKNKIRKYVLQKRNAMSCDEKTAASKLVTCLVIQSQYFIEANKIGCYVSTNNEVETKYLNKAILESKKSLYLPKIRSKNRMDFVVSHKKTMYQKNQYGIPEPIDDKSVDVKSMDLIIVPLVAFDSNKNRIGMGGGYYDRKFNYLKNSKMKPNLLGIAFDCQFHNKIQSDSWDVNLTNVITETGFIC